MKSFGIQIQLWQDCNLSCIHCWRDALKNGVYLDIDILIKNLEKFFGYMNYNYKIRKFYINLTWWEIFLYAKKILKLIQFFHKKTLEGKYNIYVNLLTNGTLLSKSLVTELVKYKKIVRIQISFDGLVATHDYYRWSWSFKKSFKGLLNVLDANINTVVQLVINEKNSEEIINYIKFFSKFPIKIIWIRKMLIVWRAKKILKEHYKKRNDYTFKVYRNIFEYLKNNKTNIKISLGCDAVALRKFFKEIPSNVIIWKCNVHDKQIIWIEPNGDVLLCPRLPIKIWNLYEDDLINIYKIKYSKIYESSFSPSDKCKKCEFYQFCKWWDLCEIYSYFGDLKGHSSLLCSL